MGLIVLNDQSTLRCGEKEDAYMYVASPDAEMLSQYLILFCEHKFWNAAG